MAQKVQELKQIDSNPDFKSIRILIPVQERGNSSAQLRMIHRQWYHKVQRTLDEENKIQNYIVQDWAHQNALFLKNFKFPILYKFLKFRVILKFLVFPFLDICFVIFLRFLGDIFEISKMYKCLRYMYILRYVL